MNYNTDAQVNYHLFLRISNKDEVCTHTSDIVYQENFLDAFHLKKYDENVVGNQQTLLLDLLIKREEFGVVLSNLSKKLNIDDDEFLFIYLFSYQLFYLTHELICKFLVYGEISSELIEKINAEIEIM
jgi:hypothetical protein